MAQAWVCAWGGGARAHQAESSAARPKVNPVSTAEKSACGRWPCKQ